MNVKVEFIGRLSYKQLQKIILQYPQVPVSQGERIKVS